MKNKKYKGVNQQQNLKVMGQTGKLKSIRRDFSRKALMPGKRISRTGKIYWETRVNRSDLSGKRI